MPQNKVIQSQDIDKLICRLLDSWARVVKRAQAYRTCSQLAEQFGKTSRTVAGREVLWEIQASVGMEIFWQPGWKSFPTERCFPRQLRESQQPAGLQPRYTRNESLVSKYPWVFEPQSYWGNPSRASVGYGQPNLTLLDSRGNFVQVKTSGFIPKFSNTMKTEAKKGTILWKASERSKTWTAANDWPASWPAHHHLFSPLLCSMDQPCISFISRALLGHHGRMEAHKEGSLRYRWL